MEGTSRLTAVEAALRRHPKRTMWLGVLIQAVAAGTAAWVVWHETKRESALAETTKYLWRLGWHDALHQPRWLALLIACVVLYVVGSMCIAMRFVHSRTGLWVGVPLAALAGLAVLGVAAVLVWAVVASEGNLDWSFVDWPGDGSSGWRRRKEQDAGSTETPSS